MGIGCFSGLVAVTLESREAPTGPGQQLTTGLCDPRPHPASGPPPLTTMEARMGTWMIHFLLPELKSQHLREAEASARSPAWCCPRRGPWRPSETPSEAASVTVREAPGPKLH